MKEYEETLKEIEKTEGIVPRIIKAMPKEVVAHEWAIMKRFTHEESKIPAKYRELIELAAAISARDPYIIHEQIAYLKSIGVTDEEIKEVAYLCSMILKLGILYHGMDYDMDTFKKEIKELLEE